MAVYLRAKFEVSNIILTGFRIEGVGGGGEGGVTHLFSPLILFSKYFISKKTSWMQGITSLSLSEAYWFEPY